MHEQKLPQPNRTDSKIQLNIQTDSNRTETSLNLAKAKRTQAAEATFRDYHATRAIQLEGSTARIG